MAMVMVLATSVSVAVAAAAVAAAAWAVVVAVVGKVTEASTWCNGAPLASMVASVVMATAMVVGYLRAALPALALVVVVVRMW